MTTKRKHKSISKGKTHKRTTKRKTTHKRVAKGSSLKKARLKRTIASIKTNVRKLEKEVAG